MIKYTILSAFMLGSLIFNVELKNDKKEFKIKWSVDSISKDTAHFNVTIDARNESEYYEFSDIRFVVAFYSSSNVLLFKDTVDFFEISKEDDRFARFDATLSGGEKSVKSFIHNNKKVSRIRGVKLLFKWFNKGIRFEPDKTKIIPNDLLYGESSIDVSK